MKDVLLVDDDEDLRQSMASLLELHGIPVRTASNGIEALAQVKLRMPNLILLDMKMPKMNGWEFAKQFHEYFAPLQSQATFSPPMIVITASESVRKQAEEIRACCGISKPFDAEILVSCVKRHLEGAAHTT